jgi:outer membrane lipase/esterase
MSAVSFNPSRRLAARACLALAVSSSVWLAACGSGNTNEPFVPTPESSRFVSFGDGLSDLGQTGGRFTVNDGTVNIWVDQLAARYGLPVKASANGGLGYALGGARVNDGTNSIANQITTHLAAGAISSKDLLIVDAGVSELAALALANPTDDNALNAAADAAGRALAEQVKRLPAAGGKQVVIANALDMGKTPFATSQNRAAALTAATRAFNDGLKIGLANVTNSVLLIDNEAFVNALYGTTATTENTTAACPSNLATTACTAANANANYGAFLFADDRHLSPNAHRSVGENAYNLIRSRW